MSQSASDQATTSAKFYAQIDYEDDYVQPLILAALAAKLPASAYELVTSLPAPLDKPLLQFLPYEKLAFELALQQPERVLINSYVIRKALIRKHYLIDTVAKWTAKKPNSTLQKHVPLAVELEVDYAEYLDEALMEAYELRDSLGGNEERAAAQRQWWILKPSMADRGNGIRLFSTERELTAIFETWQEAEEAAEEEEDNDDASGNVYASQLRHFVAQLYIHPPLLLPSADNRKFHVRTYVLAVGALRVYVYRPMLALFAAAAYAAPWANADLRAHLTNTCLQGSDAREGSVRLFWELDDACAGVSDRWKEDMFGQICRTTGELFEAAARNQMVNFQLLPCSFELFGLDFLVDAKGTAWLLEVNAFPDFKQTGDELKELVQGLFEDVVELAIKPFFEGDKPERPKVSTSGKTIQVLDIDVGRR